MPRVGGLEATRRLRASSGPNRRAPVLALTAEAGTKQVDACLAAGMTGFVSKPVEARELYAAIEEAMAPSRVRRWRAEEAA
jgi:two-component system, sensor histidine kinase